MNCAVGLILLCKIIHLSYSLTLIDSLDNLAVMGTYSEFRRVANLLGGGG